MNSIRVYFRLLSIQLRSQLQYRISFLFDVLSMFVLIFFEFISVALVIIRFDTVGGWTLGEVAFLFGSVQFADSIMDMIFSGFDPPFFGQHVRKGTFDQLLLRPVNITLQVFGSRIDLRRVGQITQGLVIFIFALTLIEINWTFEKVIVLLLSLASMFFFYGGIFVFGSTVSFWTIESIEAVNVLSYGSKEMIQYPMHIYPDWMIRFFTVIIPAIFLNYFPAVFILEKTSPLNFPPYAHWLTLPAGLIVFIASMFFWRFGIRHYQSTGT